MSINSVTLTGHLTRDMEIRYTQANFPVGNFSIAVNEKTKNSRTGEWEDRTVFVDCTLFGKYAESIENYMVKGQKVAIQGKLRLEQWEKDGLKRQKLAVVAEKIDLCGSRESGSRVASSNNAISYDSDSFYEEDIPFD